MSLRTKLLCSFGLLAVLPLLLMGLFHYAGFKAGGVRVVTALTTSDDRVLADADQLRGALLNLLLNGIEAMPEGGELFVSTCHAGTNATFRLVLPVAGLPSQVGAAL
jgi:signal transduction histidine kinase